MINIKRNPVRILVIDDDATSNMLFGLALQRLFNDPEIRFFYDAAAAIEYVAALAVEPKYIFIEINMKSANGWQVLDTIKSLQLDQTAIFMLATDVQSVDLRRAETTKVSGIITKPINVNSLRQIENDRNNTPLS